MPLHPVARQPLEDAAASDQTNCHLLPVKQARANFEATFGALPVEEIADVEDLVATAVEHVGDFIKAHLAGGAP